MSANLRTGIAVAVLLGIAVSALTVARVPGRPALARATGRAALQLAVVGALVAGVLRAPLATAAFLAVMLTVACGTTVRRLQALQPRVLQVALACVAGAAATVPVVLVTGALPTSTRYILALSGITLGGTMTACTLAGRRLHDSLLRRRDEVEAWLSLGATPRQAAADLVRRSVFEALVPALDQTRTVGLVTLPGAFVGALAGGASAGSAARFQLLVLVSLLAAESIAASVLTYLLGAPVTLPETEQERPAGARERRWAWRRQRVPSKS